MPKQELDLIEFAAGEMAQPGARAAKVIPLLQTRPGLLIDRKRAPSVMPPASFHVSMAPFTQAGIGKVRTCPALPSRPAITQCSSRSWMDLICRAGNSPRRSPHPISIPRIA